MNKLQELKMYVDESRHQDETVIIVFFDRTDMVSIPLMGITPVMRDRLDSQPYEIMAIRRNNQWMRRGQFDAMLSFCKCRICGCDIFHACEAGCWWIEKDLCSDCYGIDEYMTNLSIEKEPRNHHTAGEIISDIFNGFKLG